MSKDNPLMPSGEELIVKLGELAAAGAIGYVTAGDDSVIKQTALIFGGFEFLRTIGGAVAKVASLGNSNPRP